MTPERGRARPLRPFWICWKTRPMRESQPREARTGGATTVEEPGVHLLEDAIRDRQRVLARHGGRLIVFCPHLLASRSDGDYVLAFVITAELALVAEKLSSPKRWRWLRVADLAGMDTVAGSWRTAAPSSQPPLAAAALRG